jgi:hypothetical protein
MDELPQYFWLHITSTVVLAVLALAATAALLRWTLDEVEDRWRRASLAPPLATRPLGRRIRYRRRQQARPRSPITRVA